MSYNVYATIRNQLSVPLVPRVPQQFDGEETFGKLEAGLPNIGGKAEGNFDITGDKDVVKGSQGFIEYSTNINGISVILGFHFEVNSNGRNSAGITSSAPSYHSKTTSPISITDSPIWPVYTISPAPKPSGSDTETGSDPENTPDPIPDEPDKGQPTGSPPN